MQLIDEQTEQRRAQQHEANLQSEEATGLARDFALALERPTAIPIVAPQSAECVRNALRGSRTHHAVRAPKRASANRGVAHAHDAEAHDRDVREATHESRQAGATGRWRST